MANGSFNIEKITWYSLISQTTLTTDYATINTLNGRKIGDYEVLILQFFRGDWIIGGVTIVRSQFVSSTGVAAVCKWSSEEIEIDVKYVSDTQVSAKKITSSSAKISFRLAGLASN